MNRAPLIVTLILLVSCGQESGQPAPRPPAAAPAAESARSSDRSTDAEGSSMPFFVGRWASEEANCPEAPWVITADELRTPGEVTCQFRRVTRTTSGFDAEATCYAEGPPEQWTLKFAYAESARALLIEGAPFDDIGLIRCDDSDNVADANEAAAKGARAAAAVVRNYYELLAAGRFEEAAQLWTPGDGAEAARSSEQSAEEYESYDVEVGAPGRIEGAAGSLYISVTVRVHAKPKTGDEMHLSGEATLRRSNDVPGATREQLSWRIVRIELQPVAGV